MLVICEIINCALKNFVMSGISSYNFMEVKFPSALDSHIRFFHNTYLILMRAPFDRSLSIFVLRSQPLVD